MIKQHNFRMSQVQPLVHIGIFLCRWDVKVFLHMVEPGKASNPLGLVLPILPLNEVYIF